MSFVLSGEEIFSLAMEIEKSGYAYYKTITDSTENAILKQLFSFLAEQEIRHYEFFETLNKEAGLDVIGSDDWDDISEYIKATTDSRFFIGEEKAISLAKTVKDPEKAVDIAISFEKDTLLFFHELLKIIPEKSKDTVQQIVDEEKRHIRMLSGKKKVFQSE